MGNGDLNHLEPKEGDNDISDYSETRRKFSKMRGKTQKAVERTLNADKDMGESDEDIRKAA